MAVYKSFTFDGITSSNYGVYITGEAVFNAPARAVEMVNVPGRNGAIAIDQGRFENIEVTYPSGMFDDGASGFQSRITEFRNILLSRYTYKRLTDEYNPDEFRMGLYKSGLDVSPAQLRAGQFNITFDCKPQRWLTSGETVQTFSSSSTINNPTLFDARPLLEVKGLGTLTLGTSVLTITDGGTGANQVLFIDCEAQEAWELVSSVKVSRNNCIQYASNDFPTLAPGSNTVGLGTGITQVKITPRWWRI